VDRQSAHSRLRLGADPSLPDQGSRYRLWWDIYTSSSIHWHSRSSDVSSLTWQNAYAERLIGSIRRECIDHIVVFGERHLRHVLLSYKDYHNAARTHLALNKDAPVSRAAQTAGRIFCHPILGALHHP
jgi:transposase InsO family protein